ncbi:hypothetical protein GLOTRDRAFT_54755 [Gloeophyllum trabeum ATCC 11539]|uniref:Thioredoxin-like fold domain-containing protein n=1 Tax=Gloeophyllum trabeum (strain ATCC 11539 / FP-39264 / Madison 617) TaxID=670483 RepID=S7QIJ3_GLOTA|nr:uncharacterized protein GLOTRDRAFT_54755 [Gloeophyllum trabeum ATCC 11539]EPQ59067.1 hypothetical protein GLOTRDRAFT_54755 [Gloeophyllum trabeum ATCC 11539]
MFVLAWLALFLAACVNGQYFSEGWAPGQPVPSAEPEPVLQSSGYVSQKPREQAQGPGQGILGSLTGLLEKAGINVTDKLTAASGPLWDPRIPLITDNNYEELVVQEEMSEEEAAERVWFIVISVTSGQSEGLSKYADEAFDTAFNETLIAGDLPHVRWGRIDYLNVTGITTRWNVWTAPLFVILSDRGYTLRFYSPRTLRPHAPTLRTYLLTHAYLSTPPWSSPFAPGGPRAWVLDWIARVLTVVYAYLVRVPRWLMMLGTGISGSLILQLFHRGQGQGQGERRTPSQAQRRAVEEKSKEGESKAEAQAVSTSAAPQSPVTPGKKGKARKAGKN